MKLINTEKRYLQIKIKECEALIKYSNCFKVKELQLKIEEYKSQIKELKIEYKQINRGKNNR